MAEELRKWEEAQANYIQALQLWAEFDDQYNIQTYSIPALTEIYHTNHSPELLTALSRIPSTIDLVALVTADH